ncbi:MAG: transpeptidase family protein [Prevotella sp.]|nr:transpeptidase family protein [Prevotella sp.]
MSKFDSKKIMPRYSALAILLSVVAVAVLGKALYIMTAKHDYWMKVADRVKQDSLTIAPTRGNILTGNEELMASSLPEYMLFMDFKPLAQNEDGDSIWDANVDSLCLCLSQTFPSRSKKEFRDNLEKGRAEGKRHWKVWPYRVNYNTYCMVKKMPLFRLGPNKSGFHTEEFNARRLAYGNMALRTIGALYGGKDTARFGLELAYDSILRGTNGIRHQRKVLNKRLNIVDIPPVDGADIVTTIDVGMQDLSERALREKLKEINADVGVAIVMEVATGDVKAIVNLEKKANGEYAEIRNHAVSDLLEPGSVFKTASIMVALDDGMVDTTYMVNTSGGQYMMHGRVMKDHNWRSGGYGVMNLPQTLRVSSNIGVSRIIDEHYHNHPEKFVEGIHRLGLADDLHIPLAGASPARIRMPKKDKRGKQWVNWSNTALPWMSIGYETQVPPISTVTFYNAIANNGKMMKPRFVKRVVKDGKTIKEYPPEVLREHITKNPKTITLIQTILESVVSKGLGKKAGSKLFKVAGKTGTAQMARGAAGYHSGIPHYLVSFVGFFPADKPRYSCIVCIQKAGSPASGGSQSGPVFKAIAEGIMAQDIVLDATDAKDSTSIFLPDVKSGNLKAASYVLDNLGFSPNYDWMSDKDTKEPVWGKASKKSSSSIQLDKSPRYANDVVPDMTGMGARDAVYMLEKRGVKVKLSGRGKVTKQSLDAGHKIKKGEWCILYLE